ncbi:MAG: ABC transporter permease [Hydrogenophilales bacterium 16-64-46]|nr:MAG: ABC transporter permease [Hydrogenophilales bacterium 12-64-13]OYZ06572.1 MAG: ABC transporter permease [Hydrogenophilales bacterium 16-64-46]OZA39280.1 MAG: ABC transporter permease [Hydrogenophilales bacterium 17-64-34]
MPDMANLQLALRNLVRNRKRGMIALLTVGMAVVAMTLADGFVQWVFWAMREGTIQSQSGHIQVVRPGYFQAGAADPHAFLLPVTDAVRQTLEKTPGVKLVAPRLLATGLISREGTTVSFIAEGVDPAKEHDLSKAINLVKGRDLSNGTANEVILGNGLARSLHASPGDTVALLSNTASGGINAVEAKVAGIFVSTSQAYDDAALRLPITLAQSLIRVEGAHMWLVLLQDTAQTDDRLAEFRTRFPPAAHQLEFVPWYQRADFYNKTVALFSEQIHVLRIIIAAIIVLSISNILVMNVLERTGEIGTLLAVGIKRRQVLVLFALEGILLGGVGGIGGAGIGFGLAEIISAIGIPMPPPPGMEKGFTARINADWTVLLQAFAIAFLTTSVASIYPAWKASRLDIVNALRHNI